MAEQPPKAMKKNVNPKMRVWSDNSSNGDFNGIPKHLGSVLMNPHFLGMHRDFGGDKHNLIPFH